MPMVSVDSLGHCRGVNVRRPYTSVYLNLVLFGKAVELFRGGAFLEEVGYCGGGYSQAPFPDVDAMRPFSFLPLLPRPPHLPPCLPGHAGAILLKYKSDEPFLWSNASCQCSATATIQVTHHTDMLTVVLPSIGKSLQ